MGQLPNFRNTPKWQAVESADKAIVSELEFTEGVSSVLLCERELGVTVDKLAAAEDTITQIVEGWEYDTPVTDGWEYVNRERYHPRHHSVTLWYGRDL
jgi:hypothetical protein